MLHLLLQAATQPIVVNAAPTNEWTPAAVIQIIMAIGSVALSVIAAWKAAQSGAKSDSNAGQIAQMHQSVQSVAERVTTVALATTPPPQQSAPAPLTSLAQPLPRQL